MSKTKQILKVLVVANAMRTCLFLKRLARACLGWVGWCCSSFHTGIKLRKA